MLHLNTKVLNEKSKHWLTHWL